MLRIGLTGGIGAGKSVAARRFAELGAVVVDHDVLARRVVEPGTPGLAAVIEAFGGGVARPDGSLDRAALGRIVFADDDARARLAAILHPQIARAAAGDEARAAARGAAVVVHDIPLLVETGQQGAFDAVVVVDAPVELRVQRLVATRGTAEPEARARIAAQADDAARRAAAGYVLDGSGTVEELRAQVDALWGRLVGGPPERVTRDAGSSPRP